MVIKPIFIQFELILDSLFKIFRACLIQSSASAGLTEGTPLSAVQISSSLVLLTFTGQSNDIHVSECFSLCLYVKENAIISRNEEPMASPVSIRWGAVVLVLTMSFFIFPSAAIYCDEDDCYDLLGSVLSFSLFLFLFLSQYFLVITDLVPFTFNSRVSQNANASEIKKAYYKLSLK